MATDQTQAARPDAPSDQGPEDLALSGGVRQAEPSPEEFAPGPERPVSPLNRVPSSVNARPALTMYVFFYLATALNAQPAPMPSLWASRAAVFDRGEWWRPLTALFSHSDLGHIAANTPLFLIFGWYLRAFFGLAAFPMAALLAGIASNLLTIMIYEPESQLHGASGMLYGMVALWLVLYIRFETVYSWRMRVFRAIGVSLLLLFPTTFQQQVSYAAHAFGFLCGLAAGAALIPFVRVSDDP